MISPDSDVFTEFIQSCQFQEVELNDKGQTSGRPYDYKKEFAPTPTDYPLISYRTNQSSRTSQPYTVIPRFQHDRKALQGCENNMTLIQRNMDEESNMADRGGFVCTAEAWYACSAYHGM
jgi:hypothetical protein